MTAPGGPGAQHFAVIVVIAPDERTAEVTIEGRTRVIQGESARQTRSDALDAAAHYAAHLGRPVLVNARDANGSWQLSVAPNGVVQTVGGTDSDLGAADKKPFEKGAKGRKILLGAASAVLVLGVLGGAGYFAVGLLNGEDAATAGGTDDGGPVVFDARPAPPGFAQEAAWRHPMAADTAPAVAPDGSAAAFIGEDEKLTVIGPDGSALWSEELPVPAADLAADSPYFVVDGDGYGVALLGATSLWQWAPDGGAPTETAVPEGARVSFAGGAALVEDGDEALVPDGAELAPVEVPDGHGAMLNAGDRVLTAVLRGPWHWVAAGGDGEEVEPEAPEGAGEVDELLTARAEHVIVLWTAESGGDGVLAVHDSGDGSVVAQTSVDPAELEDARWIHGGGTIAAYGPAVFDLDAGEGAVTTGLVPRSAGANRVFGELDGGEVAVDGTGEATEIADGTARPWGLLDGRAVIVSDSTLYGLSPQ